MGKGKIIAVIVIILVVAVFGYYYFFMNKPAEQKGITFSEGYAQIKALWEKHDLSPAYLNDESKLESITGAKLNSLRIDLEQFGSSLDEFKATSEVSALRDLAVIQIELVEETRKAKEIKDLASSLSALEDDATICANKKKFATLNEQTKLLFEQIKSTNSKIKLFIELYPAQAEELKLENSIVDEEGLSFKIEKSENALEELNTLCAAV